MPRSPRFEIVRSDAVQPWHARFRAANGQVVWTTEQYARQRAALNAIGSIVDPFRGCWLDPHSGQIEYRKDSWNKVDAVLIEVRHIDEREADHA